MQKKFILAMLMIIPIFLGLDTIYAESVIFEPVNITNETIPKITLDNTDTTITVIWDSPSKTPTDYRLSWVEVGKSYKTWTDNSGNAFPSQTSYTITNLDEDTEYKIKIKPRYGHGYAGGWSEDVMITTLSSASPTQSVDANLQNQLASLQAEITTLQSEITTLQSENSNFQNQMVTLQAEITTLQSENSNLQNRLDITPTQTKSKYDSSFDGMSITATADKGSTTITVTGETVSNLTDVTFRITSPSMAVVAIGTLSPDVDGKFVKEFKVGPTWTEDGLYKITVMQGIGNNSLYSLNVLVEVVNGMTERTSVTESNTSLIQTPMIGVNVQTDSDKYYEGDTILISGSVDIVQANIPIVLSLTAPNGNVIDINQISLHNDGSFTTTIIAEGWNWTQEGYYTILVEYGKKSHTQTEFDFMLNSIPIPQIPTGNSIVNIFPVDGSGSRGCEESTGCFTPSTAIVNVGEGVVFTNTDSVAHTFTSGDSTMPETVQVLFDSGLAMAGSTFEWFPTEAGVVPYFCLVHPWATGTIIINEIGQSPLQLPPADIDVQIDKTIYEEGDIISVSGTVTNVKLGQPVAIIVTNPNGNLASLQQVIVGTDKRFSSEISVNNSLINIEGTYTVTVQYGSPNVSDTITFEFKEIALVQHTQSKIPAWVKNNAGWWADGQIDDDSFIQGIQYLINDRILITNTVNIPNDFPSFLKNNAGWWADGQIDDDSFLEILKDWIERSNIGEVQWLEASYPASGTGVVRIIDPDMNQNPNNIESFEVEVWSDSDAGGIDLLLTETNENTGIFEGTVSFITTDESSGHRLRVAEGDRVTIEYEDYTLPLPYSNNDELDILSITIIGTRSATDISFTNYRITDAFGTTITSVEVDQQVQITSTATNNNSFNHDFVYHIQVKEIIGHEAWITGELQSDRTTDLALSWIPEKPGTYTVHISLFDYIDDKNKLVPSGIMKIIVK